MFIMKPFFKKEAKASRTNPANSSMGGHHRLKAILLGLVALANWNDGIAQSTSPSNAPEVVVSSGQGNRVYLTVKARTLQEAIDSLYSMVAEFDQTDWSTILENGNDPGMNVDFGGFDATNVEDIMAMGTLRADSLLLNKDASITGRLQVVDAVQVGDSLVVTGHVDVSGTLTVDGMISGQIDDLSNHDTDNLSEGTTNLYFTNERAVAALSTTIAALQSQIAAAGTGGGDTGGVACTLKTVPVVLTWMEEIKRMVHSQYARICEGTRPEEHLREQYDVTTDSRRREVLEFVAAKTGQAKRMVENGLCEMFRDFPACDTLIGGMKLFDEIDGLLHETDAHGVVSRSRMPTWTFDRMEYGDGAVRWWDFSINVWAVEGMLRLAVEKATT